MTFDPAKEFSVRLQILGRVPPGPLGPFTYVAGVSCKISEIANNLKSKGGPSIHVRFHSFYAGIRMINSRR
jgi:hypothetical protein